MITGMNMKANHGPPKLVDAKKIPGLQIEGEWRFRHADIDTWLSHQLESETEDFEEVVDGMQLPLGDLMPQEAILHDMRANDSLGAIEELAARAYNEKWLNDKPWFIGSLVERETLASTAMEGGVAFLHTRSRDTSKIKRPFVICGRSYDGIDFGAPDGKPTYLFFLLGLKYDKLHLPILGRLARLAMRNPTIVSRLRATTSPVKMRATLLKLDAEELSATKIPTVAHRQQPAASFDPKARLRQIMKLNARRLYEQKKAEEAEAKAAKKEAQRLKREAVKKEKAEAAKKARAAKKAQADKVKAAKKAEAEKWRRGGVGNLDDHAQRRSSGVDNEHELVVRIGHAHHARTPDDLAEKRRVGAELSLDAVTAPPAVLDGRFQLAGREQVDRAFARVDHRLYVVECAGQYLRRLHGLDRACGLVHGDHGAQLAGDADLEAQRVQVRRAHLIGPPQLGRLHVEHGGAARDLPRQRIGRSHDHDRRQERPRAHQQIPEAEEARGTKALFRALKERALEVVELSASAPAVDPDDPSTWRRAPDVVHLFEITN